MFRIRRSPQPLSWRARTGLLLLAASTFMGITTEQLPIGLLPQMVRDLHASAGSIGLLVTVYAVLVIVLALPITILTRTASRKPLLLAAITTYAVSNLAAGIGPDVVTLVLARALGGVAHALLFSLVFAYAIRLVPEAVHGRAIAVVATGASLGPVLGVPLAAALGSVAGWRDSFVALAGVGALVAVAGILLLPPVRDEPGLHRRRPSRPWRTPLLPIGVVTAAAYVAHAGLYTYVTLVLTTGGTPVALVAPVLLLLGVGGMTGSLLSGTFLDRRARTGLIVCLLVAGAASAALSSTTGIPVANAALGTVWLIAFSAASPALAAAALRVRSVAPEVASAVSNATANVGVAIGSVAGATIVEVGGPTVLELAAAGMFIATAAVVVAARRWFPERSATS